MYSILGFVDYLNKTYLISSVFIRVIYVVTDMISQIFLAT